ncbi:MAG: hypothetical protein NT167_27215 [Verrucomicrobia bacterium]|nr:hypothetical protein [Verrucomicrobiota bacterium]
MKTRGTLIGVAAGAILCALGILDFVHVRETWEHSTFHPGYEMDSAVFLVCLGFLVIAAFLVAGLVGWARRRAKQ